MKNKAKQLDVDFIGGQNHDPMTKEEKLAISEFIRLDKEKRRLQAMRKTTAIREDKNISSQQRITKSEA